MKLYLNETEKNGSRKYLDVSFWSFFNMYIASYFTFIGCVFALFFIIGFISGILLTVLGL